MTAKLEIYDEDGILKSGGGSDGFTIKEADGAPSGTCTTLVVTNGTLTDDGGGQFTIDMALTVTTASYEVGTVIDEETLAGDGTFDTGAIDTSGYERIEIYGRLRSATAATTDRAMLYFNNDETATNYSSTFLEVYNSVVGDDEEHNSTIGGMVGNTAEANQYAHFRCTILQPGESSHYKMARSEYGYEQNDATLITALGEAAVQWHSTNAITQIEIKAETGDLEQGSWWRVVGYRTRTIVTSVTGSIVS